MILNLQPQYELSHIKEDEYSFLTDSGVIYTAYFIIENAGFNIYSFGFDKNKDGEYVPDVKIKNTILCLISAFIERNDGAVLYVCDSLDGRALSRRRLFYRWFYEYNDSTLIIESIQLENDDYSFLSSVILKANCF